MHLVGYTGLLLAFLIALLASGWAAYSGWRDRSSALPWIERGQAAVFGLLALASLILFWALGSKDFSFAYVFEYTDTALPWYYSLTAFWAGQEGSFLFWGLVLSLFAFVWSLSPAYKGLEGPTKVHFWLFCLAVQAFFLLMLITVSNPFRQIAPAPADGNGLNPLLQHPGMIFHPPLLFLGYAGFAIPACLGLAAHLAGGDWLKACRNWVLLPWVFLTSGIFLGAWWSYMELGWGGYWAWDPVENASLIPWLSSTALIHTAIVGRRSGSLQRFNLLLAVLTLVLCFFGTFLTRSGVLDSLHAFGNDTVGGPLLVLMGMVLLVSFVTLLGGSRDGGTRLPDAASRQGVMLLMAWLLLALGLVIVLGTLWPVISRLWAESAVGVQAGFYNRVCLPLFAVVLLFLAACPWLNTRSAGGRKGELSAVGAVFVVLALFLGWTGMTRPLPLFAASMAGACLFCLALVLVRQRSVRNRRPLWAAYAVHAGVALVALGIAFSGPYQQVREAVLSQGESLTLQEYTFVYQGFRSYETKAMTAYRADLLVERNGRTLGRLQPERRMYRNFDRPFAEASVLPGLGDELYATLLGFSRDREIQVQVSVNPLVNWIWIGGTIMCLVGFLTLRRKPVRTVREGT
jgi:cytochrome c-type biogenesis protein CcmF